MRTTSALYRVFFVLPGVTQCVGDVADSVHGCGDLCAGERPAFACVDVGGGGGPPRLGLVDPSGEGVGVGFRSLGSPVTGSYGTVL